MEQEKMLQSTSGRDGYYVAQRQEKELEEMRRRKAARKLQREAAMVKKDSSPQTQ